MSDNISDAEIEAAAAAAIKAKLWEAKDREDEISFEEIARAALEAAAATRT